MAPRRRLQDLYITGKAMSFDDGQGEAVSVYLRKLNPVEHETAMRRANAARSRTLSIKATPESDDYQDLYSTVVDFDREGLFLYLVEDEKLARAGAIEAELGADEEWSKDDYLEGLRDAWEDKLKEVWASNKEEPEAARVWGELNRFNNAVNKQITGVAADFALGLEDRSDEALRQMVLDKFLTVRASLAWLTEYRRCEVWLATREMDKKTRVFKERDEVDDLPLEVYQGLADAYREMATEPTEGKESAGEGTSSRSSDQPANQETEPSSGPQDAAA